MAALSIRAEGLGKAYRLAAQRQQRSRYRTLQEDLKALLRWPLARLRGEHRTATRFWALQDVSFEVQEGEVLGIIGRNGAGKSTLLKILSRITEPTTGYTDLYGRVGSLLEVGTGFHPELTGRENIFLNGAILGMRRQEIQNKFDEIVSFAEVERFLDTPVKRYSSGMYVRLAFAVAAHLEPEILVVDEVLAVGDAQFQKKCLGKMEDVAKAGRTVLFVSHNMGAIRGLCSRVLWLNEGQVEAEGESEAVITRYLNTVAEGFTQRQRGVDEPVQIERVIFRDGRGEAALDFAAGSPLTVEIHYHAPQRVEAPYFWLGIVSQHGPLFGANMLLDDHRPHALEGRGIMRCTFDTLPLLPQAYTVRMGVRGQDGMSILTETREVGFFNIVGKMSELGFPGQLADALAWTSTPLVIPYTWQLPDGRELRGEITPLTDEKGLSHVVAG